MGSGERESVPGERVLDLEPVLSLRAVRGCTCGPLFVQAWTRQPLLAEQEELSEAYERMIELHPDGFASMALIRIREEFGSPDAQVRRLAIEQYRRLIPFISVSSIVIDSRGVALATVRVFMSALLKIVRPETPTRIFSDFDEAFDWMLANAGSVASVLSPHETQLRRQLLAWWEEQSSAD